MEQKMWNISLPHWWEFVLRAVIVYGFLLVILRLTGKRQVGPLAPFDLVLLLVVSNAVQNAMNGGDNSVTGGILLTVTLGGLHWGGAWPACTKKRWEALCGGRAVVVEDADVGAFGEMFGPPDVVEFEGIDRAVLVGVEEEDDFTGAVDGGDFEHGGGAAVGGLFGLPAVDEVIDGLFIVGEDGALEPFDSEIEGDGASVVGGVVAHTGG